MSVVITRLLFRHAFWLALFIFFCSYGMANAESISFTTTVPFNRTDWTNSMSVPQFDPTLGILTSIEMTLTGAISGTVGVENEEINPINVLVQEQATERITLPDNTQLQSGGIVISQVVALAGTDGIVDFGGSSGATFPVVASISNSSHLVTPSAIMPFVGTGQITLPVTAIVAWTGQGSGNMVLRLRHLADSTLTVRYVYTIPTIAIKKFTNGFDADNPNDLDVPQLQPGTIVTWSYQVTNTGTITIPGTSIVVTDSQPGVVPVVDPSSDVNSDNLLAPGEVWIFIATGLVEDLTAPTTPVTIVSGCNPGGTAAPGQREAYRNLGVVTVPGDQAEDPSHYCNPPVADINLEKTVYRGHNAGASCPGDELVADQIGTLITYCFVITNTGETYLDTLVFTDTLLGINLSQLSLHTGATPLAPGGQLVYTYESTIPAGDRLNTALVEANPTDDQGQDLPGLANPRDQDTAQVRSLPTGIDPNGEPLTRLFYIPLVYR